MDIEKCLEKYSDDYYSAMFGTNNHLDAELGMKQSKEFLGADENFRVSQMQT